MTAWSGALDALEEKLRRQEDFLDGAGASPDDTAWVAPPDPLPTELALRARAVLARNDAAVARTRERIRRHVGTPPSPYR